MAQKYLTLAKAMLFGLALLLPLLVYQNIKNREESLRKDALLKDTVGEERRGLALQLLQRFLDRQPVLAQALLQRQTEDGPILGLDEFPSMSKFAEWVGQPGEGFEAIEAKWIAMLWDESLFFSGLPKRYAALVEILSHDDVSLSNGDSDRLYQVMCDFWSANGVDNGWYGVLLNKLPERVRGHFASQRLFLGDQNFPSDGKLYAHIQRDAANGGGQFLVALGGQALREINRDLEALNLEIRFQATTQWRRFGEIRVSAEPAYLPVATLIRPVIWRYLTWGLILELVLALIFFILDRYAKIYRLQKQLLAATSHELRTPLAVMRQFAEMLIERNEQFPVKYQPYHRYLYKECLKMQFLVENLLTAARFEHLHPRPKPEPVALRGWLGEIRDSAVQFTPDQELVINCPDLEVYWDCQMMAQVLTNLIENSRNYAGTPIEIHVLASGQPEADWIEMRVRDFGNNFDLAQLRKVTAFNPNRGSASGLGLGLSICRRIVQAHGGRLQFEDSDPGLCVIVELPREFSDHYRRGPFRLFGSAAGFNPAKRRRGEVPRPDPMTKPRGGP